MVSVYARCIRTTQRVFVGATGAVDMRGMYWFRASVRVSDLPYRKADVCLGLHRHLGKHSVILQSYSGSCVSAKQSEERGQHMNAEYAQAFIPYRQKVAYLRITLSPS